MNNEIKMKKVVLITGTPGVGKSTIASILVRRLNALLVNINELVDEKHLYTGYDKERKFKIVDIDALCNDLDEIVQNSSKSIIIEGHLSHYFDDADVIIVLRTNPDVLKERLKIKGFDDLKIRENVEAEAIDICTWEAFHIHGEKTNEIDTSYMSPDEIVDLVIEIISGNKRLPVGNVRFLEFLRP